MENSTSQIKQIDNTEKQKAIFKHTKETIDFTTGEVISQNEIKISKEEKKENFIKVYIENLYFMATSLNNSEKTILFFIMANMNYQNVITISTELRQLIEKKAGISRTTIFTALNGLKDKNVLIAPVEDEMKEEYNIYSKNSYILNPNVIGKGSIKDLKKLRQTVITNFDFDKLEATQEVIRQVEYDGFEEVKQDMLNGKSEITEIKQSYNEQTNSKKTDIKIADVEEDKGDYSVVTLNPAVIENKKPDEDKLQEKNIIEYEDYKTKQQIELLREQNKSRELALEEKKIDLEILKMKKETKQGSLFENN